MTNYLVLGATSPKKQLVPSVLFANTAIQEAFISLPGCLSKGSRVGHAPKGADRCFALHLMLFLKTSWFRGEIKRNGDQIMVSVFWWEMAKPAEFKSLTPVWEGCTGQCS